MEGLVMAGQLLLGLSILVVIHELGHYLAARAFGIKVEKFYLFFDVGGVKLFNFKKGDTEYGIGWLPLGGYVKITGMIDESMDKDFVQSEPKPYEFRAKPAWQRLIVMLGGIIMNVILGILIFTLHTAYYGESYLPASELQNGISAGPLAEEVGFKDGDIILSVNGKKPERAHDIRTPDLIVDENVYYTVERAGEVLTINLPKEFAEKALNTGLDSFLEVRHSFGVNEVQKGSNAEKAGLKEGDVITAVNDTSIGYFNEFSAALARNKNNDISLTVLRSNEPVELKAEVTSEGTLGFKPKINFKTERYNFGESLSIGTRKAWEAITINVKGVVRLIKGDLPADKSLSGFIGIGNAYGGTWNWISFWSLTALLSMILAFMNLLPIPALDGGHVLFLLVEMVRRKPLSYKFLEVAQMVGMVILFLLMGFALYNDFANYVF